jgi:hypothetical protein
MMAVEYLIEIQGVYDGWSAAVLTDPPAYVNRWSVMDDPTRPEPGYERRFQATEDYMAGEGLERASYKRYLAERG